MFISYAKIQNFIASLFQSVAAESLKAFKFSFIIGSKAGFFSASSAIAPLIGFFGSRSSAAIVFALRLAIHAVAFGLSVTSFFYHVPTLFSTLYLAENSKFAKLLIPLICIALFIAHPAGFQTSWYALYWVLPCIIAYMHFDSIFLRSLASTLVSHAVGTIIWLYAGFLSPQAIEAIATIAWLERIVLALMLTCAYYSVIYAQQLYTIVRTNTALDPVAEQV